MGRIDEHKVIFWGFLGGVFLWLTDALLDKVLKFPDASFLTILIYDAPKHELAMRPIMLLSFTIFGVLISQQLKKLKKSEGRYKYLFDHVNDGILIRPFNEPGKNEKFILVNQVANKVLGYTNEELLQLSPADLLPPEKIQEFLNADCELEIRGPVLFETTLLSKKGQAIPVEISSHLTEFNEKPVLLSTVRDISPRKEKEEEIRRLASFPQLSPNPILEVDARGAITFCNGACHETLDNLKQSPEAFLPGDLEEIWQAARNQEKMNFMRELEITGTLFAESIYYVPEYQVLRIFPQDITENRKAEEALKESARQLRVLTARLMEVQEDERARITKELHDELGQSLMLMKLQIDGVREHLRKDQGKLRQECSHILKTVDTLIENIRRLIRDLSPAVLEELGLTSAIKLLLEELNRHHHVELAGVDIEDIDHFFPSRIQLAIYRVFQEAFTNIGKHARARQVSVLAKTRGDQVFFLIKDNGLGFNPEEPALKGNRGGIGLTTMKERIRSAGGHVEIRSQEGKGTEIAFNIPTKAEEEGENALPDRLGR